MGVLVEEEVVSGGVCGNPAGQVPCFCWVGMDQLNCLFHYVQTLWGEKKEFIHNVCDIYIYAVYIIGVDDEVMQRCIHI